MNISRVAASSVAASSLCFRARITPSTAPVAVLATTGVCVAAVRIVLENAICGLVADAAIARIANVTDVVTRVRRGRRCGSGSR